MARTFLDVDPRTLRLPPSRLGGADPGKFWRQIHRFGTSVSGMPPIEVYRDPAGNLVISDGVTRATRVAKLWPGATVQVEVLGDKPKDFSGLPTIGDRLP
jgi:hypothetical protein